MKSSVILLLFLTFSLCGAINLPFYAKWQSLHSTYFDTLQDGKELSWDECYRAEFGFRVHPIDNVMMVLETETEQFFDEPHLSLKTLIIGYDFGKLSWEAGTSEWGYGAGFALDRNPILQRGYQPFRFQSMRMNSLGMTASLAKGLSLSARAGGNKHNQASALISLRYYPDSFPSHKSLTPLYKASLTQDFRAMDNHWRTPVSITALGFTRHFPAASFGLQTALALLPEWEATEAHHELFAISDLVIRLKGMPNPALGAVYKKQNYAPYETQQYQFRLEQGIGDYIRLIPQSNLHIIDGENMWQHRIFARYDLTSPNLRGSNIGLYYDYSHNASEQGRHTFGLALDFVFEPNF
ncbi:MAG: hypothetical protein PHU99_06855 [Candidatus Cloacimonetes bacterium]|nr:hypothetical protein [Candidatus Cloacimonadota bacterium]MDD3097416.1 hypothetical protein [Candidatus Cloacimonadota bacterium]